MYSWSYTGGGSGSVCLTCRAISPLAVHLQIAAQRAQPPADPQMIALHPEGKLPRPHAHKLLLRARRDRDSRSDLFQILRRVPLQNADADRLRIRVPAKLNIRKQAAQEQKVVAATLVQVGALDVRGQRGAVIVGAQLVIVEQMLQRAG